jgi:hypothetical protein
MSNNPIKIGDRVRFLNDTGGGRVTAILSKDLVHVETKDGFEIPTYIKNLVIVNSEDSKAKATVKGTGLAPGQLQKNDTFYTEKEKSKSFKEQNQIKGNDFPEFIFAALPEMPGNPPEGKIILYLINDCNYTLIYHFATKLVDKYSTLDAGILEPNTKVELETIHPKLMGNLPEYCFQLLFFKQQSSQMEEPVQKEIHLSPVKFFKSSSFVKNNYFKTPALLVKLADHPLKAELDKLTDKDFHQITIVKEPKKSISPESPKSDLVEVDLHIHQLIDDFRGMSNADMLKMQLDTFRKEMDNAIASGTKKIVFIHGVGDGVLKNEIRRELQRKYSKYPFQDASFREYGFGATMAVLRK